MMSVARAGSTTGCVLLIFPAPAVSVSSPAASPEFTTTLPLTPAAPLWMCPMLIAVLVGQPVMSVSNNALAAVMVPLASLVVVSVNVPLPEHEASGVVIGGTSFDGLRSAVKTNLSCGVWDGGHPPPLAAHPGTARATPSPPYIALLREELASFHPLARIVTVALVLASRRTGVTRFPALWSPDFPRRLSPPRPSGLLGPPF